MTKMKSAFIQMNQVMQLLLSCCDPHIFYSSLRVFLGSFSDGKGRSEGLVFEGVSEFRNKPQKFTGASGFFEISGFLK
jgi:hypothetical protein